MRMMAERAPTRDVRRAAQTPFAQRGGPMTCQVVHDRGSTEMEFGREAAAELLAKGGFFWLDLDRPDTARRRH
jgi:hypothetical protein